MFRQQCDQASKHNRRRRFLAASAQGKLCYRFFYDAIQNYRRSLELLLVDGVVKLPVANTTQLRPGRVAVPPSLEILHDLIHDPVNFLVPEFQGGFLAVEFFPQEE